MRPAEKPMSATHTQSLEVFLFAHADMPATPSSRPVLKTLHHVPPTKPENSPTKHSHPPTQDPSPTTTVSQEEALTAEQAIEPPPTEQPNHPPPPPGALRQSQSSPPSPPNCPPLESHSPVWYFKEYLKCFYSHPKDPVATWPPSPSNIFINLAVIIREKISTEELHKFMLATLNKGVDTILKTKAPVELEQLMDTKPGIKQQHIILVEGAPGVGKTTLSWEICQRWSEGKLFRQYSLILLLRLRDHSVQTAEMIKDFVLHPYEERLDTITQHLKDTNGQNTLILLEGLDELPQHLLTQTSIFTRLLAGEDLPNATILVTSRPSATAQLWKKWKARITKHVEILGFTEDNITAYVASILHPRQLPSFDTYLCTAPSIRQLMYIPLHSGIVVELYRMCTDSDKLLPTNKTDLYTVLVKTILTRYLTKHDKYKNDEIDVKQFKDLPDDVYPAFMELTELAYNSVTQQQLVFKDKKEPIQHLGFMDAVAELFPLKHETSYSFNFLHLSIQEFLGAVYVSQMDTSMQEQLLANMSSKLHLHNMAMFLAGITKFKAMNQEHVKRVIQSECKMAADGYTLTLSKYCLELAFETEVNVLHGHRRYTYKLTQYSPLFDFTALGYFIARSQERWALQLGDYGSYMQTTSGVDLLVEALRNHGGSGYIIDSIQCRHKQTEVAQRLLEGLPSHTLLPVKTLELHSETLQPLPASLPGLVSTMNTLRSLMLGRVTSATLANTLHVLARAPICTLEVLDLSYSQFSPPAMAALSALLEHSTSLYTLRLGGCDLTPDLAILLATGLHHPLPALRLVNLLANPLLREEEEGGRARAALEECTRTNTLMELLY